MAETQGFNPPRNIVTLKWGNRYGVEYVNKLRRAVARHLTPPFRFICFTDDPAGLDPAISHFPIPAIDLPAPASVTGWRKLGLFRRDLPIEGLALFLDLDLLITGPLDSFFEFEPGRIAIIQNWVHWRKRWFGTLPRVGNSSVFRFEANQCGFVLDQFEKEKEWALANFRPPQSYLTHCIRSRMAYWPDEWVRSFKRHCRPVFPLNYLIEPRLPPGARIIAFHGKPDPPEAAEGYRGKKLHHYSQPARWIQELWDG